MPARSNVKPTRTPVHTRHAAARMPAGDVLARLRKMGSKKHRDGMTHFGIEASAALGIKLPDLRKLAREIGRDHALAQQLWSSGVHEARQLACMIADPALMTNSQANAWARDIGSWDICDGFAYDLMSYTRMRWEKPALWSRSDHEFVRRAAFALIAGLAVHDKEAADEQFIAMFPLIAACSRDDRNFVKKAVNWALRQIGKRNITLNAAAIACAEELRATDSRSARWIAADALRELRGDAVQARLNAPAGRAK